MYLLMKYKVERSRVIYLKLLISTYKLVKNIFPTLSKKIKIHIEKVSLEGLKNSKQVISNLNI